MALNLIEAQRRVKIEFESRNVFLKVDAMRRIAQFMENKTLQEIRQFVTKVADILIAEQVADDTVTLTTLEKALQRLVHGKKNVCDTRFAVVDTRKDWKRQILDSVTKSFKNDERVDLHAEFLRYDLVRRNVANGSLLSIELLHSRNNSEVRVLATLRRDTQTCFIEDPTGTLKINLEKAVFGNGLFIEGCVYEFQGFYKTGLLTANEVALPKLRPPLLVPKSTAFSANDQIVILSDVFLDDPVVLKGLNRLLEGFAGAPPVAFFFCGPFLAHIDPMNVTPVTEGFRHFKEIFAVHAETYSDTNFIFVPSAADLPVMDEMPRCPAYVGDVFKGEPNFHMASNPCKVQIRDQTFVINRCDVIETACKNAIQLPENRETLQQRFCETIMSQLHFAPLPRIVCPVNAMYEHIYHLSPAPQVLVLADKYQSYQFVDAGTHTVVVNPGSFGRNNLDFLVYYPHNKTVDLSTCA